MNRSPSEVEPFAEELSALLPKTKTCEVAMCVPFSHISDLKLCLKDSRISIGAQDISIHDKGAFTGEISADMLADLDTRYVIVGHSECRQYHGDTDYSVGQKAVAVLEKGMSPIICVGETLEQRERGLTKEHIGYQVKAALSYITEEKLRQCVIAYEPVWAIGTGKTATDEEAQAVCKYVRAVIGEIYSKNVARGMSILYGGSMNPQNARGLLSMPDIDGGLIGGASLKPLEFSKIIGAVEEVTEKV